MSRLGILIASFVLVASSGASPAAAADRFEYRESGWSRAAEARSRGEVRDRRDDHLRDACASLCGPAAPDPAAGPRRYRHAWVALSSYVGLGDGDEVIRVHDRGTFTQLRVQAASGASYVDHVVIHFADGSRQTARVRQQLDRRSPRLEIQLDGNNRRIERIAVLGDARRDAAIQVFGI